MWRNITFYFGYGFLCKAGDLGDVNKTGNDAGYHKVISITSRRDLNFASHVQYSLRRICAQGVYPFYGHAATDE